MLSYTVYTNIYITGDYEIVPLEYVKFNRCVCPVTQLDLSGCAIYSEIKGAWVQLKPSSLNFSVLHRDRGSGRIEFSESQRQVFAPSLSKVIYRELIAINQVPIL